MARPLRIEFPGAFYHVTSRGNERRELFRSRADRERFILYLESAVARYGAVIHSYCLMTNHYHLFLETPHGNLSDFMRYVNGAYTTYFNTKRKRAGHLFQGRYKSIVVDADEYAIELSRYIHLNPVRAGMVAKPEDHEWSSYRLFAGISHTPGWLKTEFILAQFGTRDPQRQYRAFVEDLLGAEYESPMQGVIASTLLGTPEFVAQISEKHVDGRKADRSVPAVRALSCSVSVEDIARTVEEIVPGQASLAKKLTIYICHRYGGGSLKAIGERFGIGDSAVSLASKRFGIQAETNDEIMKVLERVLKKLNL